MAMGCNMVPLLYCKACFVRIYLRAAVYPRIKARLSYN